MENKSKKRRISIILLILLIINVSNMMRSETIFNVRGVDALQLMACGALVGILIVNLVITRKDTNEQK